MRRWIINNVEALRDAPQPSFHDLLEPGAVAEALRGEPRPLPRPNLQPAGHHLDLPLPAPQPRPLLPRGRLPRDRLPGRARPGALRPRDRQLLQAPQATPAEG